MMQDRDGFVALGMSDMTITFAIVIGIVVLFIWDGIPVVLVALGTALALYFTGVHDAAGIARRTWRSGGDLHRLIVRRQRRAGCHRRHRLGRPEPDRRAGRIAIPAAGADDVCWSPC